MSRKTSSRGLSKGRRHSPKRRGKRVLISCNAKVTEPRYFRALCEELGISGALIHIVTSDAGKDPLTLVRGVAKELERDRNEAKKEGFEPYHSAWAVTDADRFGLSEAQALARRSGVELVISNPCFEVWLIDHRCVCPENCADAKPCQDYAAKVGVIESTDHKRASRSKMKDVSIPSIEGRVREALANADRHNTQQKKLVRDSDPDNKAAYSVWTDAPKLVRALMEQ